jgi:hypothetical protein
MCMTIKNKDGSTYNFSKPNPSLEEQKFWSTDKIVMHNKFGDRFTIENMTPLEPSPIQKEVKVVNFKEVEKQKEDAIKIVQAIEESKPKKLSEETFEIWCLPCLEIIENTDPLYNETTSRIKYGDKFVFRARILELEDLHIKFLTNLGDKIPAESVIFPKMRNRRWWRVQESQEVKGFNLCIGIISDYQPSFVD